MSIRVRNLLFYIMCLSCFSNFSYAYTGPPAAPNPDAPVAPDVTVLFNEANMTATISWNKNSADVKSGETREVTVTSDRSDFTTVTVPESRLIGSLTFNISNTPGSYSICHVTKKPQDYDYVLGIAGTVYKDAKACGVHGRLIISSPVGKIDFEAMDVISIKRDYDSDLWLQFDQGSGGISSTVKQTFTLHNLTNGTSADLNRFGAFDTDEGSILGNNGNGKFHISTNGNKEKLLSAEYKISSQNCPGTALLAPENGPYPGKCSAIKYSEVFTIEETPSLTTITSPKLSSIPSSNVIVEGIPFTFNSINPRYIVSKRSRITGGVWGAWAIFKTFSLTPAELDKSIDKVLSVNNLKHNTEHEFKVSACNGSCLEEAPIELPVLAVQYSIPSNLTSSPAVSTNGQYNISWGSSVAPNATFFLKETNSSTGEVTETKHTATGSSITTPKLKVTNDAFSYQIKTCYDIEGTFSCTAYSTPITTTVSIQVTAPSIVVPANTTNFSVPLSWNAVDGVSGNDVYYKVYSANNALLHTTAVGVTNWTYTAPQNGSYGFQVQACVPAACSGRSITKTVSVDVTPSVSSLLLTNESSGYNFTLNWSASTRATSYTLEHKDDSGIWSELVNNTTALNHSVTIPSADTPHGTHEYRVKACVTSHGYCSTSNVVSTFVDTRPSVGNITIDRITSQCDSLITDKCFTRVPNISITWDKDTSELVQFYEINEVASVTPILTLPVNDSSHLSTANIDNLNTGTYSFKYRACSNYGVKSCSVYSDSIEVQVSIPVPVTQAVILDVKENGTSAALVTGPYTVEWQSVPGAALYKIYRKQHSSETFQLIDSVIDSDAINGKLVHQYAPSLMAWGEHSYYVTAENADNDPTNPPPVSAIIAVTVEQDETIALRKQLYYSEADEIDGDNFYHGQFDRDNAAFRYLDLMYSFNSDAEIVVSDFFSGDGALQTPRDFSELYDVSERNRIDLVLLQLQENLRSAYDQVQLNDPNAPTRFTRSKELLLDVFYDRAVAEIVLGNQDMDVARIGRLREESFSNEVNDLAAAYDHYYQALSDYSNLFIQNEYQYSGLLEEQFNLRKQESPRYWQSGHAQQVIADGSAEASQLLNSYKDLAMYFDLMSKVINTKVAQTKLEVNGIAVSQTQLDLMKQDLFDLKSELEDWTQSLQSKFKDTVFTEITALEVMQSIDRYDQAVVNINNATSWINGDTNVLGLNDDSLIIVSGGYGIDGNQTYYSYDAIVGLLSGTQNKKGYLTIAKEDFSDAIGSYENYRHNQDRLATEYSDRNTQLNNLLVGLIGWEVPLGCHEDCVITSEEKVKGSQISLQVNRIEQADVDMETAVVRLLNLKLAIEDMVADEEVRTGIEGLINENILDYGSQQASISQKISKIQARAAKARKKSSFLSGAVQFGIALYTQNYVAAAASLVNTASEMKKADADIKNTKSIGVLQALSTELAAAERVKINEAYTQIRQTEFASMIRSRLRDVSLLELEIEKAALSAEQEQERLMGMVSQAARLMTQVEQTNQNLADRYFADPIHASRLTKSMEKAERSFQTAQEWMFYAAQALEYKWLVDFSHNGYTTEDILRARSVTDLEGILDSGLQPLDSNKNVANAFQQGVHTLSFKEHVFGYHDRVNGVTQYYPHPAGDTTTDGQGNTIPVLLRADDAFVEELNLRQESLTSGNWLNINFDTFKPDSAGTFFAGPEFNDDNCMVVGGTYLDKIESVSINVPNFFFAGESSTNAYLSYGGTSYIRNKEPGIEYDIQDGSVIDEFTSFPVLFWDDAVNDFDRSLLVSMSASLSNDVNASSTTTLYKERSVAASDWNLKLQLNSPTNDYVAVDFIDDIELIFNHRYLNRNYDGNCQ